MSNPSTPIFLDKSKALAGVSEALFVAADAAYNACQERIIHNPSAANPLAVNLTGGAAALNTFGSITIPALGTLLIKLTGPVTVIGTAGQGVTAYQR